MKRLEPPQNDLSTNMMMMMAKGNNQNLSNSGSNIISNTGGGNNNQLKSFVQRKGIKTPKIIHQMVNQANHRFWLSQNIFNQDYIQFLTSLYDNLWKKYQKPVSIDDARLLQLQILDPPLPQYEITRFGLTVFLTTILRYKHKRESAITFVKLLKKALARDVAACFWIIETFSFDTIIRQILLECPIMQVTHHIEGLIKLAMNVIYPMEKDVIKKICSQCFDKGRFDYNRFGELFGLNVIAPEKETKTEEEKKKEETPIPPPSREKTDRGDKPKNNTNIPKYYPQALLKNQSKCPYLITFINSLLHQIFPNLKKSDSFAYFYKIFSDFIDLGPQAKQYLLSCRTLNVFASIIQHSDKASIYAPECLRDIIQIVQPPDLKISLGFGKIIPDDKHIYRSVQGSQKSLTYMLQTLSKLIKSCVFKEHIDNQKEKSTSLKVQAPCFKLSEAQSNQLIKCLIQNRSKVLLYSTCRIARRAIGQIYAHITFNNHSGTIDLINALFGYIERDAEINVQRFFDILMIISRVKDDLRLQRIQIVLNHINDQLKRFKNFLYFTYILQNFFILLAKKEAVLIKKCIDSNQKLMGSIYQSIKRFYDDNKNIHFNYKVGETVNQALIQINFFKKMNFDQGYFHQYLTQDFHNRLIYYIRDAYEKIKKIYGGSEIKTDNSYYLYDIEQVENFEKIQKGSYVDFLAYYEWNSMKVEQNTGEFMKLSFIEESSPIIYFTQTDSDFLAYDKTMSKANLIPEQCFASLYNGVYEHNAKLAAQAASRS